MFVSSVRPGQIFQDKKARVMNRSGGTVAVGDVLALDLVQGDAATSGGTGVGGQTGLAATDAAYQNAVAVAASNLDGLIVVVDSLLSGAGADDTEIQVSLLGQAIDVEVESTADIAIGARLKPVAANTYLVVIGTAAADSRSVATALEARTADDAGLIKCFFYGGLPPAFATGA